MLTCFWFDTDTASLHFTDTAPTYIYTLSLHDALPISRVPENAQACPACPRAQGRWRRRRGHRCRGRRKDRKSTRLNSSHVEISYAVFCLKKKKSILLKP